MSEKPKRIQRKRTKGWRMPPNTVSVTRPGKWGNKHRVGNDLSYYLGPSAVRADAAQCADLYRREWEATIAVAPDVAKAALNELRGKDLACWCPLPPPGEPDLCHAAVLLEIANQ